MCARASRSFRRLRDYEDDELDAVGRKNAKHSEEMHDEVASTLEVMARFLAEQLQISHPDDWQEACIEAAFTAYQSEDYRALLPSHYDIANYDFRALAVVMEYNLPLLTFERGTKVTPGEIHALIAIRNDYEHRGIRLNYRRWRNDLETIRTFRSKMQTDEEIAEESYSVEDLPKMEEDSALYLAKLDNLQHQIEAVTNTILGLDKRLGDNAQVDERQFAELRRQREADELHDRSIGENAERITLLTERDAIQRKEIIGLLCVSVMSLGISLVALLKKK